MKKSLLAVAVAAALPVVAHAQVTLSGRIDNSVQKTKSATTGVSATGVGSSLLSTNELTLRGSEDIGGGLKANFILNSQFNSDQKAAFDWAHRGALVGLSGGFGSIDIGRSTCTTLCSITATGLTGNMGNLTSGHTIRPDNSVSYSTPSMSGFTARVLVGLKENPANAKELTEISATYSAGPLIVQAAYVDEKGSAGQYQEGAVGTPVNLDATAFDPDLTGPSTVVKTVSNTGTAVGAGKHSGLRVNYNAGFATLHVRWMDVDLATGTDNTQYGVSASFPLGGNRSVAVDYRVNQPDAANADETRISAVLVQNLSKRTNVYAAVWSDKYDAKALTGKDKRYDGTAFAVGVRHNF